jgi:hypothetical protein
MRKKGQVKSGGCFFYPSMASYFHSSIGDKDRDFPPGGPQGLPLHHNPIHTIDDLRFQDDLRSATESHAALLQD